MPRKTLIATTLALALLVAASGAQALRLQVGELVIYAEGGFAPTSLPKHENAPITIHGGGKISTISGALPPVLETLTIDFDRHGSVETTGLEVCTAAKLEATTVAQARRNCPDAIVGGSRPRRRLLPRTAPDPGRLADHPLQRARVGSRLVGVRAAGHAFTRKRR